MDMFSFDALGGESVKKRKTDSGLSFDPGSDLDGSASVFSEDGGFFDAPQAQQQQPSAQASAGAPNAAAPQADSLSGVRESVARLRSTTDPRERAVLTDEIARTSAKELRAAGHDVSFDGDDMVIDGRRYVIGDGQQANYQLQGPPTLEPGGMTTQPVPMPGQQPPASNKQTWDTDGYAAPGYMAEGLGATTLNGYDSGKLNNADHQTPKYVVGRILSNFPDTPEGLRQALPLLQQAYPGTEITGTNGDKLNIPGVGNNLDVGVKFGEGGGQGWQWLDPSAEDPTITPVKAPPMDDLSWLTSGTAGASGVSVNQGVTPVPAGAPATVGDARFAQTGPTYQPGDVSFDDLEGFDLESLRGRFGANRPADVEQLPEDYEAAQLSTPDLRTYKAGTLDEIGDVSGGPVGDETEAALLELLRNPSSLDDRTVSMLKAKNREDLSTTALMEDEDLQAMARRAGIDDSRWLASERLASRRDRDDAVARSNRDIDIEAALTRGADTRSAIDMGASFTDAQASRQRSEAALRLQRQLEQEGLTKDEIASEMAKAGFEREGEIAQEQLRGEAFDRTLRARQQNIDNLFRSREEQRAAEQLATNTALAAAAQRGDRMALREEINQEAARLGLAGDELQLQYTLGLLDDATKRYGIDVGATVDREKLAQAGREFAEDLAFRLKALAQADAQFAAEWGLDAARFEHDADIDNWDRYMEAVGG
jgi:hypothetical protein